MKLIVGPGIDMGGNLIASLVLSLDFGMGGGIDAGGAVNILSTILDKTIETKQKVYFSVKKKPSPHRGVG